MQVLAKCTYDTTVACRTIAILLRHDVMYQQFVLEFGDASMAIWKLKSDSDCFSFYCILPLLDYDIIIIHFYISNLSISKTVVSFTFQIGS
jgi:hypothetical protein